MTDTGDTATREHQELIRRAGLASWHELWAAVDSLLARHRPHEVPSTNSLACTEHHPLTGRIRRDMDIDKYRACPDCVVGTYLSCTGRICCSWPCEVIDAIQGALGEEHT